MPIKTGIVIAGNYKVEKSISQKGGMASVYLASVANDPRKKVAIKFARREGDNKAHEEMLLEREADMLRLWDWRHPGIVRVYPIQWSNGRSNQQFTLRAVELPEKTMFMVMEYLSGGSLTENLHTIQGYSLEWKLELFYQILVSLSPLHQKGYAHWDIKPDNIVFRGPIDESAIPQPVLIDFALAHNGNNSSQIAENSFSLGYAAPERLLSQMGVNNDEFQSNYLASDIWGLGLIFYEILTSESLMRGTENKVRTSIADGSFRTKLDRIKVPDIIRSFLKKMLDQNPGNRPGLKEILYAIEFSYPAPRIRIK